MNIRKIVKGLGLNVFRTIGLLFALVAILQFRDHFVGYAFISIAIASLIFYFGFRGVFRDRKPL